MMFPKSFEDVCNDSDLLEEYKACKEMIQVLFDGIALTDEQIIRVNALNSRIVEAGYSNGMCLITK